MKTLKQVSALVIVIAIMVSNLCLQTYASSANDFVVENGILTAYSGPGGDVVIPGNIGITEIGKNTFYYNTTISSVIIPEGVTSIGSCAFAYCSSLKSITIPESVTTAGDEVLSGTAIPHPVFISQNSVLCYVPADYTHYTIPDSVTSINAGAFYKSRVLRSVYIPDSVTSIGQCAFIDCCSLSEVNIPDSVTSIGISAFNGCSSLTSIEVPASVTSVGRMAFSGTAVQEPILSKDLRTLYYVPASFVSYEIPDSISIISGGAFDGCKRLNAIRLSERIIFLGEYAFSGCSNLTEVTIPISISTINNGLFWGCSNLKAVSLPANILSIGELAFNDCSNLSSIVIPGSVKSIGNYAFYDSGIKSIYISNVDTTFGYYYVFMGTTGLTIYAPPGSTSEAYANEHGVNFVSSVKTALPSTDVVKVNNVPISIEAYNINGYNYFKLRDIAAILNGTEKQFGVSWNNSLKAIDIESSARYIPVGGELTISDNPKNMTATLSTSKVLLDGRELATVTAYNINGYNYFKLRDIGMAINFGITWNGTTSTIEINTSKGYIAD